MEILQLVVQALLGQGAIGITALIGWALASFLLYREYKRKEQTSKLLEEKDKELDETKDHLVDTVKEMSGDRIKDLKELTEDYNELASNVMHTLDKLTSALDFKK